MLIFYGFGIGINTLLSIFLQEPVEDGGYGFSADRNASCEFFLSSSIFFAATHTRNSYVRPLG